MAAEKFEKLTKALENLSKACVEHERIRREGIRLNFTKILPEPPKELLPTTITIKDKSGRKYWIRIYKYDRYWDFTVGEGNQRHGSYRSFIFSDKVIYPDSSEAEILLFIVENAEEIAREINEKASEIWARASQLTEVAEKLKKLKALIDLVGGGGEQ